MASQTRSAGLGQTVDNIWGTVDWGNPTNIYTSNNAYATANVDGPSNGDGEISHYLWATQFGFTLPSNAQVDGIVVEFEKSCYDGDIEDDHVYIIQGGSEGGTNKAKVGYWGTTDYYDSYGGVADKWGLSWTYSQINSSNFGVCMNVFNAEFESTDGAKVDHVRITVYYTEIGTNIKIKVGGAWKDVISIQIKVGGAWKAVTQAKIAIGEAWKTIFGA